MNDMKKILSGIEDVIHYEHEGIVYVDKAETLKLFDVYKKAVLSGVREKVSECADCICDELANAGYCKPHIDANGDEVPNDFETPAFDKWIIEKEINAIIDEAMKQ